MRLNRFLGFVLFDDDRAKRSVQNIALESRKKLLRGEKSEVGRIARLYRAAAKSLLADLEQLVAKIERQQAAGLPVTEHWLYRQARLLVLLRDISDVLSGFGEDVADLTEARQKEVLASGQAMAEGQIRARVSGSFDRLPADAFEQLAGRLSDGTPLKERFRKLGPEAARRFEETLTTGLAKGENPRVIGKRLSEGLGIARYDATRIARTEVLQAYRTAGRETYKASGVVLGWRWLATKGSRTCPVCLAMHGRVFTLDTPFGSHPQCRCTQVPVLEGEEMVDEPSYEGWLKAQPKAVQEKILGTAAAGMFRAEEIGLDDFVKEENHPDYGLTRRTMSLKGIRSDLEGGGSGGPPAKPPRPTAGGSEEGPDELSAKLFRGKRYKIGKVDEETADVYRRTLGSLKASDLAEAMGAPTGSRVKIGKSPEVAGAIEVEVNHRASGLDMLRTFRRDESGRLIVRHDFVETNPTRSGVGTRVFAKAVEGYRRMGVDHIEASVTGSAASKLKGYHVWPRLGFNARIPGDLRQKLVEDGFEARDLNDLFLAYGEDGSNWWKDNGHTVEATFDLDPASPGSIMLEERLRDKGIRL
jgi:SPP1 gp7 family putative phage head morphogenesis protein